MRLQRIAVLIASILCLTIPAAHADSFVYAVSDHFAAFRVDGTITTDTNLGVLLASDITGLNLVLTDSMGSETLTYQSADDIEVSGYGLSATPDGLNFDYDEPLAFLLFRNSGTGTYLCYQNNGCDDYTGAHESVNIASAGMKTQQQTGLVQIGTYVPPAETPEPSSLVLLGTGAAALATLVRGRRNLCQS